MNYNRPTPETDSFMLLINDSEIDLTQVESKLKDMECERDAALEGCSLLDWADEEVLKMEHVDYPIADSGDFESIWEVTDCEEMKGFGKTLRDALLDVQKSEDDPSKWDYVPKEFRVSDTEEKGSCQCVNWCRAETSPTKGITNHHPRCEHYNDSLIDVWKVSDGTSNYYDTNEEAARFEAEGCEDIVIKRVKMHREIYEQLPEFEGF